MPLHDDRVLVAGVGNIFLGDDGFGCEVARRLARHPLPDGVRVADYGIGGIHLAYDLLGRVRASASEPAGGDGRVRASASEPAGGDGRVRASASEPGGGDGPIELLVLIDALPRGAEPGTVTLIDVVADDDLPVATVDSHAMDPATVFASLRGLGGTVPPTVVVGCEPADLSERMGLSPAVEAAVEPTVAQVLDLLAEHDATRAAPAVAAEGS